MLQSPVVQLLFISTVSLHRFLKFYTFNLSCWTNFPKLSGISGSQLADWSIFQTWPKEVIYYTNLCVDWWMITSPPQGCKVSPWQPMCTNVGYFFFRLWTTQAGSHLRKCSNSAERQLSQFELKREVVKDFPETQKRVADLSEAALTHADTVSVSPWKPVERLPEFIHVEITSKARPNS